MRAELLPNRWLRLRHPQGFDNEGFALFQVHVAIFRWYVEALLVHFQKLPYYQSHPEIQYVFFAPEISSDRQVVSLPLGGKRTLATRGKIENWSSYMLWQFFPKDFLQELEEGLTETIVTENGPVTTWREPCRGLVLR